MICPGINAEQARIAGNFEVIGKFKSHRLETPSVCETVILRDAVVGGSVFLQGCVVPGREGVAVACDRLRVDGSVMLRQKFEAQSQVSFAGAEIRGDLDLTGFSAVCEYPCRRRVATRGSRSAR